MLFRKILLPTDLSPEGERAFAAMAELARALRPTVVLLHVVENAGAAPVGETFPRPLVAGTKEELERVRKLLAERRGRFPADVEVITDAIVAPSVAQAVADYAKAKGCDSIVLSSHAFTPGYCAK